MIQLKHSVDGLNPGFAEVVFRASRLLFWFKSDISVSCTETIFRDANNGSWRTDGDRNAIINLEIVSVQETETSDLNKNNNLGERNTTLQTSNYPKEK